MACDKVTAILRIAKDAGSTAEVSVHGDTVIWHDSNPLGITEEQVLRFEEDKSIDNGLAIEELAYSPLDFEQGLGFELQWLHK